MMRVRLYGCVWSLRPPIALAAAFHIVIVVGIASAQTVVVRNAPANTPIEVVLNGTVAATATTGADRVATLPMSKGGLADRATLDVFVWVDECGSTRRVLVMNYVQQPPAADGCRRTQIPGLFLLQRVTTLLIDLDAAQPTMRVRQGPLPDEWLRPPTPSGTAAPRISIAPRGAILFGGGESASLGGLLEPACGDVSNCSADNRALSFAGGLSYWFSQYIAAEASYVRPKVIAANGTGDRFRFDSDIEGGFVVFAAKGGFPVGRFRLFGTIGANRHRATFTTHETIDDTTATIGGVSQTVPGGTTTLQWRTEGWGPVFGGGTEIWLTTAIGIYGEFSRLGMKGSDEGVGEASTDSMITAIMFGGRYRIGGR